MAKLTGTIFVLSAIMLPAIASAEMTSINAFTSNGLVGAAELVQGQSSTDARGASCPPSAVPAAERRRLRDEYARRQATAGKASADAWVSAEGPRIHRRLVAQGLCPHPGSAKASSKRPSDRARSGVRNRSGKPCKKTRLVQRVSPGLGGAAMSMTMVPVCVE